MSVRNATDDGALMLEIGQELGILSPAQIESVRARQSQLRRGGITLPLTQIILERKFLSPAQFRQLSAEVESRKKATPAAAPAAPPQTAALSHPQYEILSILSRQPHCRVYKARDKGMDRLAVLKVLHDPQWSERFRREVVLAGKLRHPNIVLAYGSGELSGMPLLALEYVEGSGLDKRLESEGNIPEKTAWMIAREVAKGLAFAAEIGILHRDIKPANIVCGDDGRIKIMELGLSKAEGDTSGLTTDGMTVGTPFYIAPEQTHSTRDLDVRSDIYSLGCTVYHALTGTVPFLGDQIVDIMRKHVDAPRPNPREILPEIGEGSARLVMRMMAIEPEQRPQSALELIAEIEALLPALPTPEETMRPVARVEPSAVLGVPPSRKPGAGSSRVPAARSGQAPAVAYPASRSGQAPAVVPSAGSAAKSGQAPAVSPARPASSTGRIPAAASPRPASSTGRVPAVPAKAADLPPKKSSSLLKKITNWFGKPKE